MLVFLLGWASWSVLVRATVWPCPVEWATSRLTALWYRRKYGERWYEHLPRQGTGSGGEP